MIDKVLTVLGSLSAGLALIVNTFVLAGVQIKHLLDTSLPATTSHR